MTQYLQSAQEVQDRLGYVVLAYQDQEEYDADLRSGLVKSEGVNSRSIEDGILLRVLGAASLEDWAEQCRLCGDPLWVPGVEAPHVGYLKVMAE